MLRSKRSLEGYLLQDNRASGDGMVETAVLTCSHCHRQILVNPDRTRPREYCAKCDHYICDWCAAARKGVDECRPMNQVLDLQQAAAFRAEQSQKSTIYTPPAAPAIVLTDAT